MECGPGRFQVMHLTPAYVRETFLVRGALEGLAAELAAPRCSDAQLAELATALDGVDAALRHGDTDVYIRFDDTLHRMMYETAGNAVLLRELVPLLIHIDFIRYYSRHLAGDHITCSQAEHRAIVEALHARDPRGARRAMEAHIRDAGQRIERLIDFHERDVRGPVAGGAAPRRPLQRRRHDSGPPRSPH